MLLLGDILRRHAAVRGDKTAYVCGPDRVTYRDFHARSNQLGRAVQRLGVRRGDRLAVLAGNCTEYPLLYFAALKLGAIVVPINARFTDEEIAAIVEHAEAATLAVDAEHVSARAAARQRTAGVCAHRHHHRRRGARQRRAAGGACRRRAG